MDISPNKNLYTSFSPSVMNVAASACALPSVQPPCKVTMTNVNDCSYNQLIVKSFFRKKKDTKNSFFFPLHHMELLCFLSLATATVHVEDGRVRERYERKKIRKGLPERDDREEPKTIQTHASSTQDQKKMIIPFIVAVDRNKKYRSACWCNLRDDPREIA